MSGRFRIAIVTVPIVKAGITPLSNFINIISNFTDDIFVISGNEFSKTIPYIKKKGRLKIILTYYNYNLKGISRIIEFSYLQLKDTISVLKVARKVDLFIFFMGGAGLILPLLACKVLNKKILLILPGSSSRLSKFCKSPFWKLLYIMERIGYFLSDHIIIYSPNLIKEWNLKNYKHKIIIAHHYFLDFDMFNIMRGVNERDNIIGFIGRLSGEKGILNFLSAIPHVLKIRKDMKFIICGSGKLANKVISFVRGHKLERYVKLKGWVSRENIPTILNEIKLLVLPSYTEGLPNVILEAMACGTPTLATSVGAIRDVIKEGENGFLLEYNDPQHIAERIVELISKPELLEKVSKSSYEYVRENFSYEKTLELWRRILQEIENR